MIYFLLAFYFFLLYNSKIKITIFDSYIQKQTNIYYDFLSYVLLVLLFPYSIYKIIKTKQFTMNTKQIKNISIIAILSVILVYVGSSFISINNADKTLRNTFTQKMSERTTFYDKMWKIISQKSQIAVKNDSSFRNNIQIIMSGRKDGDAIMWKWVTETNPNANYNEVSALYQDLSRTIEAERNGFFEQEKVLQSVKQQHDQIVDMFPGSVIMSILGRSKIDYTPITSDVTEQVIKTGKDNNTKVFE